MGWLRDVQFALRVLIKNRWFTMMAAVVLALGIGANNAVFTLVNAVLLRGLPFPKSEQIMMVMTRDSRGRETACRCSISTTGRKRRALLAAVLRVQRLVQRRRRGPRPRRTTSAATFGELQPDARHVASPGGTSRPRKISPALSRWC